MEIVGQYTPETIISEMISCEQKWDAMVLFVESVLRQKKPSLDRVIEGMMIVAADAELMLQHNQGALVSSADSGAEGDDEDSS